ncbi:hypothetical protein [Mameliella alba]|uniref:hypothetical protein n=1 Tax=Mameliella alba TaxID=561184 RepID=UPI000840FEFB|nr:hypothetical protein [Mameliella alba]ODM45268.1 hypothetical protein A9320_11530 [Ruegeria sp. PBVC088]OWV46367.1 hypothetical protein CDZ96_19245 [Mameliella alba]GGF75888.1 hypothetical protein GCM10011319_40360 [Mameliella alba]
MKALRIFAVLAVFGPLGTAQAADFSDPTWPCVQRKVERMSMGLMWPIMPDENAAPDAAAQADITELAELLALRRIEVAELEDEVAGFAATYKGDPQILTRVFAEVFDTLAQRRSRIISGIGEFSLSQIELSEKIDSDRGEMDRLLAAETPDFDRVDALEEQIDWNQTIYTDRQQSITYLCETPTLLEKRLYAIARLLQAQVREDG